jgi:hypothetical protein
MTLVEFLPFSLALLPWMYSLEVRLGVHLEQPVFYLWLRKMRHSNLIRESLNRAMPRELLFSQLCFSSSPTLFVKLRQPLLLLLSSATRRRLNHG